MPRSLSLPQARRIALAAQGFGRPAPAVVDAGTLDRLLARLRLFQIDSVSVVARAHYLPALARLGAYDPALFDRLAWGPGRQRRWCEYWAHEASLLPVADRSLFAWRMARADRGEAGWARLRPFAGERRADAMALLDRVRADGPLAATDLAAGRGGWWEWSEPKAMLEWLFWAGHLTTAARRPNFARVYDLPERVLPAAVLAAPVPAGADARAELVARAAAALGIATAGELRDYFRLSPAEAAPAIRDLEEAGVLVPVAVPGWPAAWAHRDARLPRAVEACALLAPFDPVVWERGRCERLFGFRYRLEIYTPAHAREHGYYVLPFLLGDRLVGRVDLKADRAARALLVHAVHWEDHAPAHGGDALAGALARLAAWLGLERVGGRA